MSAILHDQSANILSCSARFAGVPVQLLFDTGASDNIVGTDFLLRMVFNAQRLLQAKHSAYANGEMSPFLGSISFTVRVIRHKLKVDFLVAKLSENFDVMIGRPWLASNDAHWAFEQNLLALRNATILVSSPPSVRKASCEGLTRVQSIEQLAQLAITDGNSIDSQHPLEVRSLSISFEDIFQDLPSGLPPVRGEADHTI